MSRWSDTREPTACIGLPRRAAPLPGKQANSAEESEGLIESLQRTTGNRADVGTKDGFDARKRFHFRLREIAKRFTKFSTPA